MTLRIPDRRFLSTPSARRATIALCHFVFSLGISIHALREEGDFSDVVKQRVNFFISIHALREEGDQLQQLRRRQQQDFYPRPPRGGRHNGGAPDWPVSAFLSTPSARRATSRRCRCCRSRPISIHALREEGDPPSHTRRPRRRNFYPRPPRGGRRLAEGDGCRGALFLSTPSARRATLVSCLLPAGVVFLSTPSARRATCGQ